MLDFISGLGFLYLFFKMGQKNVRDSLRLRDESTSHLLSPEGSSRKFKADIGNSMMEESESSLPKRGDLKFDYNYASPPTGTVPETVDDSLKIEEYDDTSYDAMDMAGTSFGNTVNRLLDREGSVFKKFVNGLI